MNLKGVSAIVAMSDDALAAATPDQKLEMLRTLILRSYPNQRPPSDGPRDQEELEEAIIRILASAPDAASFDRLYYRLNHTSLYTSVTYQSRIRDLAERARASVKPGDWEGLRRYVDTVTGTAHSGPNLIKFLIDGQAVMKEAGPLLMAAKNSIHIEIFQLQADHIGWGLAKILSEKAQAGVSVRFLIDGFGSDVDNKPEARKLIAFLRESGAEVIVKEPPLLKGHLDHRKIVVIDGKAGFTGGMNIGEHYQEDWHDQQTLVIGPAVARLQEAFLERWQAAGGQVPSGGDLFPALMEYPAGAETQVVGHMGNRDQNIKAMYLRAIGTAQSSIRIATPYFADKDVVKALCLAAKRGVRVQLVFPEKNNQKLVQSAANASYPALIKAGVEIYEYKERMAHLKVAVIDGRWATFGSSNLDARSLINNDELNLIVTDPRVAGDIERRLFDVDILKSDRVVEYSPGLGDYVAGQLGGFL
jgi:cardiolipin synthase